MLLPEHLKPTLKKLVADLVSGDHSMLEQDGRSGRLDAKQIEGAILRYKCHLIDPPISAYDDLEAFYIKGSVPPAWAVDIDLWTIEEGRSDLTLSVTISEENPNVIRIEIDDLHVL
jgi:hypothetical protein